MEMPRSLTAWIPGLVLLCGSVTGSGVAKAEPVPVEVRILLPDRKPASNAQVRLIPPPTEVEEEHSTVVQSVRTNAAGVAVFSLPANWATLDPTPQVEVLAPGTRRARYALRDVVPSAGEGRGLVQLEEGLSRRLTVLDGITRKPLAGVAVGPINPDDDAPAGTHERTYPFFVTTNEKGEALVDGLLPGVSYMANLYLPGYQRRRIRLAGALDQQESIIPGGTTLTVHLRGHRSGEPKGGLVVALTGPDGSTIMRRANKDGIIQFLGLGTGRHNLRLEATHLGETLPVPVDIEPFRLAGQSDGVPTTVPVPEGLNLSGYVREEGTSTPLPGVTIALGAGIEAVTDENGRFQFQKVFGPWPRQFQVRTPGYKLDLQKQRDSGEVAGFDLRDRDDLSIELRRERYLEVVLDRSATREDLKVRTIVTVHKTRPMPPDGFPSDALEPTRDGDRQQVITSEDRVVLELDSAEELLVMGSTSQGTPRLAAGQPVTPGPDETTTTVHLRLQPSAELRATLVAPEERPVPPKLEAILFAKLPGQRLVQVGRSVFSSEQPPSVVLGALFPGEYLVVVPRKSARFAPPWARKPVSLTAGQTTALNIEIEPGGRVAGTVTSADGAILPEIAVTIHGAAPTGEPMQQTVMSDGTGKFVTEGWGGPSVYSVTTRHHLWNDATLIAVPVPSDDVRIVLQARPTLGVQLDSPSNDRLLATAHLLHETRRSDDLAQDYPSYASEQSQPFGGVSFVQFRPQVVGALRVGVRTGDRWIISERMEWGPHSQATTVTLSPQAAASLVVRISGDPTDLAQAEWTLTNLAIPDGMGGNSFDPIGSPGQTVEFASLPAGPYLLVGSSPSGGTVVISDLELAPGERRELAVSLAPSLRTVRGRVTDGAGSPVEARVAIHRGESGDSEPLATTRSNPSTGEFILHAVPGGSRYLVLADSNGARGMAGLSLNLDVDPPPVEIKIQRRVSVRINLPAVLLERINRGERLALRSSDGELFPVAAGEGGPPLVNLPEGTYAVLLDSEETGLVRIAEGKELVDVEPVRR